MWSDGHQSGFHGVTGEESVRMSGQVSRHQSVGGLTEQVEEPFHNDHWHRWGGECLAVWDTAVWHLNDCGTARIPTHPWTRGKDEGREEVEIPWALLRHQKLDLALLRPVFHFPAHLSNPAQRKANDQAFAGLEKALGEVIRDLKPDVTTLTGDANRDMRLAKNKRLAQRSVEGLGLRVLVPPGATIRGLLRRRIELIAVSHRTDLAMLAWLKGYDHRGVEILTHPRYPVSS